jgi:hypothetical protein
MGGDVTVRYPRHLRPLIALAIIALALAITVAPALATNSRTDYVAQADPICKASFDQIDKRLPGLIKRIARRPNITPTIAFASGLALGGKIFAQETNKLAVIPPPPGDEAIIAGWLDGRRGYKRKLDRAVTAGKHNKKKQMLRRLKQAFQTVAAANQLVAGFGFQYCVISNATVSNATDLTASSLTVRMDRASRSTRSDAARG